MLCLYLRVSESKLPNRLTYPYKRVVYYTPTNAPLYYNNLKFLHENT